MNEFEFSELGSRVGLPCNRRKSGVPRHAEKAPNSI